MKLNTLFFLLLLVPFLFVGCRPAGQPTESTPGAHGAPPDEQFGDLFVAVQTAGLFPDSKTFADAIPRSEPSVLMQAYQQAQKEATFDLRTFVDTHFSLPERDSSGFISDSQRTLPEHIRALWPVLVRQTPEEQQGSLIPLPHPFVVPGGRFQEMYYWDSYFTMLGLAHSGRTDLVGDMLHNFAFLIDEFGFVPNGNRTYYLSRSQPPFFAAMVQLYGMLEGDSAALSLLPQLEKEYAFWMDGSERVTPEEPAYRRVVRMPNGALLNRYWDDLARPRPEAYREDVETAARSERPAEAVWRDLRAACESGWDFSSRWLAEPPHLHTIHTTDLVPVDLNSLLFLLEETLSSMHSLKGDGQQALFYKTRAMMRMRAVNQYCWDAEGGVYGDYDFVEKKCTGVKSLAMMYPLCFGLAQPTRAIQVSQTLEKEFLRPGGLVATLAHTGQQWDAPYGWAPLHWIAVRGLENYKFHGLSSEIQKRWVSLNKAVFESTGKLTERYHVEAEEGSSAAGEYPLQDGFGWTNGVLLDFLKTPDH